MGNIICKMCGLSTRHPANAFFERKYGCEDYLMMCFHTDFVYLADGKMCTGKRYQCIIQPPYTPLIHGPVQGEKEGFENDWIYFSGNMVEQLIQELDLPVNVSFSVDNSNYLASYIASIMKELKFPNHFSEHYISGVIYDMLVNVARKRAVFEFRNSDAYVLMQSVREEMLLQSDKKVSLEQLAMQTGYSVSRFCELYRKFYHSSPITDLMNARINEAKNLLLLTDKAVGEIAQDCGFESIHYFSKVFKKKVGCAPTQYRNNKEK